MTRIMGSRIVPEKEEEFIEKVICDICGKESPQSGSWKPWAENCYDTTEPIVSMKTGDNYPEGGSGEIAFFDICPHCFENKIVPAIVAMGATLQAEEWET